MSYLVTLDTFILRVRERTDKVGSHFVEDDEITRYVNAGIGALCDLVSGANEDYFLITGDPTTITSAASGDGCGMVISVPDDFWKLRSLYVKDGARAYPLERIDPQDRWRWAGVTGLPVEYFLTTDAGSTPRILLFPNYTGSTARIYNTYIPAAPTLDVGTDTFNCISAWDDYVITYAAINVRDKEEVSTSTLQAQLGMLQARIEKAAKPRDQAQPRQVRRVRDDFGGGTAWRTRRGYP